MAVEKSWANRNRLGGLRRFAFAITVFTILGHAWLGFEQSWLQPIVALVTAYAMEIGLEWIDARANGRPARFRGGGVRGLIDFVLSAHISGLAVAMLLYANDRLWPIAFATAVAIGSKSIIRMSINGRMRHILNPSNFGITITLLLFPWVGIAQPYHFTENLSGAGDWILPALIVCSGSFLNARYTRRVPLLLAWLVAFGLQAVFRHTVWGAPITATLLPATGVAFILFTFYMVTDPATTPASTGGQILFGASVGIAYGLLVMAHIVFGLFFGLTIVCLGRGLVVALRGPLLAALRAPRPRDAGPMPAVIAEGGTGGVR